MNEDFDKEEQTEEDTTYDKKITILSILLYPFCLVWFVIYHVFSFITYPFRRFDKLLYSRWLYNEEEVNIILKYMSKRILDYLSDEYEDEEIQEIKVIFGRATDLVEQDKPINIDIFADVQTATINIYTKFNEERPELLYNTHDNMIYFVASFVYAIANIIENYKSPIASVEADEGYYIEEFNAKKITRILEHEIYWELDKHRISNLLNKKPIV